MGKIKLRIFVVTVIAAFVTLIAQSSLAYYSTVGVSTNVITSGNIKFIIHETTDQGTAFPKEGVYIAPGDIVSKRVFIENVCEHPFYLRVKVIYGVDSNELSSEECFKLNIDDTNWVLHDGWYYYNGTVNPDEKTPHVFSHVEIVGAKLNNNYLGKTLTLTVKAQAVQSENNPVTDGKFYEAFGWPTE